MAALDWNHQDIKPLESMKGQSAEGFTVATVKPSATCPFNRESFSYLPFH